MARKSEFSVKVAETVCQMIADGYSLRQIGEQEGMPDKATILRWLAAHEAFRDQYARAREMQAEHFADEILEIADDGTNDWMERQGKDGESLGYIVNGEAVQRSRLRVESRKWLMSKVAPKKYGEKQSVEHSGPGGGPIKTENAPSLDPSKLDRDERDQLRQLLAKAMARPDEDTKGA